MSPVLMYFLVVWVLASVPTAPFLGWLCGLNQLALDEEVTYVAPAKRTPLGNETRNRDAVFGDAHPSLT